MKSVPHVFLGLVQRVLSWELRVLNPFGPDSLQVSVRAIPLWPRRLPNPSALR